jgi:hypothetical protein
LAWPWMKAGRWRDRAKPLVSRVIYVTDQA